MSAKKQFSFLAPKPHIETINDEKVEFFPLSVGSVARLRQIGGPLAHAFSTIFQSRKNDQGITHRKLTGAAAGEEMIHEAITADLAAVRSAEQAAAWQSAVDTILEVRNIDLLGELIEDSLGWEKGDLEVQKLPADVFIQMVMGVLNASLGSMASGPFKEALAKARGLAGAATEEAPQ